MEDLKIPKRVLEMRKAWAAGDAARDAGLVEPSDITAYKDISYGEHGIWNLLDVYTPQPGVVLPVIVNVHGGGYFYGDKELYRFYCMHLAQYGFTVVSFNYRLSPEFRFPAAIEDINRVLCWMEANAEEYALDLEHVFMIGDSAGAQLSSHYGAINSNPEFATLYDLPKTKIRIRGLSLACGMYDLKHEASLCKEDDLFWDYFGEIPNPEDPKLDVIGHITADYPPTYLFSCVNDFLYPACMPMYEILKAKGIVTDAEIYGTAEEKEIAHVFHVDMRLAEGERANVNQTNFLKALCGK